MTSRGKAAELGATILAEVGPFGTVAGPDNSLHYQPSNAIRKALGKAALAVSDLDLIEINEAFAAVGIASMRELGVSPDIVNVNGGAIAVGHPLGASGDADRADAHLRAAPPRRRTRRGGAVRRRRPGLRAAAAGPELSDPLSTGDADRGDIAGLVQAGDKRALARVISWVENGDPRTRSVLRDLKPPASGAA